MPPQNLPRWRRYLTVEPVVLFYTFGIFMSLPVLTQYVYFKVSKFKGFPYNVSETAEKGCNDDAGANSSLKELEKEVQFKTGAPNDGFLLNALKTLFRLSRVLSNL